MTTASPDSTTACLRPVHAQSRAAHRKETVVPIGDEDESTEFESLCHGSRSGREAIAEHREAATGFRLRRLVLKNVPVLGELAVFEAHDIGGDP